MGQSVTTRLITPTVQALYPENTQLCCADHWPHARVRTSLADAPDFRMTAKLIDGKAIAAEVRQAVKAKIDQRRNKIYAFRVWPWCSLRRTRPRKFMSITLLWSSFCASWYLRPRLREQYRRHQAHRESGLPLPSLFQFAP